MTKEVGGPERGDGGLSSLLGLRAWKLALAGPSVFWFFPVFFVVLSSSPAAPLPGGPSPIGLAGVMVALMISASWGFLLNDLFDREADSAGGRSDDLHGHGLGTGTLWGLIVATASASWVLIFLSGGGYAYKVILAFNYLVAILYSVPPVKLKVRGFWGFLANSLMERPLPIIVLLAYMEYFTAFTVVLPLLMEATWSVFKHQAADIGDDVQAGVRTFAVRLGKGTSERIVMEFLNPLSVVSLLALVSITVAEVPSLYLPLSAALVAMVAGVGASYAAERSGRLTFKATPTDPPYIMFLNFSYRYLLLPVLAAGVMYSRPEYYPVNLLLVLTLVYVAPGYLKIGRKLLRAKSGEAGRTPEPRGGQTALK